MTNVVVLCTTPSYHSHFAASCRARVPFLSSAALGKDPNHFSSVHPDGTHKRGKEIDER